MLARLDAANNLQTRQLQSEYIVVVIDALQAFYYGQHAYQSRDASNLCGDRLPAFPYMHKLLDKRQAIGFKGKVKCLSAFDKLSTMASALIIVITGLIALMTFGASYYLVFPIFLNIQSNPSADCQASANCTSIFDGMYDVMFVTFEMMIGGIFFSMYMRATRRDQTESYSTTGFEGF